MHSYKCSKLILQYLKKHLATGILAMPQISQATTSQESVSCSIY